MIRIAFELIILAIALAASGYSYIAHKELRQLEEESTALKEKFKTSDAEHSSSSLKMQELRKKERELDAAKAALSSGVLLSDLETVVNKSPTPTAEQHLALGGLRILIKGSEHPEPLKSFESALQLMDWKKQLKIMCAAKIGMIATGRESTLPHDCADVANQSNDKSGNGKDQPAGGGAKK